MFYIFAPLVIIITLKISKNNLTVTSYVVLAIILSGLIVRTYMTRSFQSDDSNGYFSSFIQFHSRYDELASGVFAALLIRLRKNIRNESCWWLSCAIILLSLFSMYITNSSDFLIKPYLITKDTIWIPTLFSLCGACLLLGLFWRVNPPSPIIFLARISYPLYLVHILFLEVINPFGNEGILLWMSKTFTYQGRAVILIIASIFLSYLVSLLIEYPFVRLYKKKLVKVNNQAENKPVQYDDAMTK